MKYKKRLSKQHLVFSTEKKVLGEVKLHDDGVCDGTVVWITTAH